MTDANERREELVCELLLAIDGVIDEGGDKDNRLLAAAVVG